MAEFELLEKTEVRIDRIVLNGANLNDVASVVAEALGMDREEVLVTDAIHDTLTVDILRKTVDAFRLVGKQDLLLKKLARLPGVEVSEETSICSEGILGWIVLNEAEGKQALKRSDELNKEIRRKISSRAIVFSTGFEVASGQIEDTNQRAIVSRLKAEGYSVASGSALKDDRDYIFGRLRQAAENEGYGLIVTTGGVGAEAKDCTIEALLLLDPAAATPYISKFRPGTGRHAKDGVRIGAGQAGNTLIVALPGPNDEVRSSLDILVDSLKSNLDKHELAGRIAGHLRDVLQKKMKCQHGPSDFGFIRES